MNPKKKIFILLLLFNFFGLLALACLCVSGTIPDHMQAPAIIGFALFNMFACIKVLEESKK